MTEIIDFAPHLAAKAAHDLAVKRAMAPARRPAPPDLHDVVIGTLDAMQALNTYVGTLHDQLKALATLCEAQLGRIRALEATSPRRSA